MTRAGLAALAALALSLPWPALSAEKFAVLAVGDLSAGPDGDLTELTHQLRAACRDRVPNVLDSAAMRARLVGHTSGASESELDRAYGGALAVYQNGEFDSALRTLRAIVEDLESLPETDESYFQWKRALLQLGVAANASKDTRELEAALAKVARVEPNLLPDPDQFSPGFRKRFEEVKAKVRNLARRKLTVSAEGRQGMVFVNGKPMGISPLAILLPSGVYRVGGAAGTLRVPSFRVDLEQEDRSVVLDFALADSLRLNAGPGLAVSATGRANAVVRAGAWLGVDKLIVVTRSEEGQAHFLVGAIYDVLRGSLLREGSVRMVAGGVPSVNLSALAAFLLTGQSSREVKELSRDPPRKSAPPVVAAAPPPPDVTSRAAPSQPRPQAALPPPAPVRPKAPEPPATVPPAEGLAKVNVEVRPGSAPADQAKLTDPTAPEGPPRRRGAWKKPASIGAGVLALGLGGLALHQSLESSRSYSEAEDQLAPGGTFKSVEAQRRFYDLISKGDRARKTAAISAGGAAALAVTAVVLGWKAWRGQPADGALVELKF